MRARLAWTLAGLTAVLVVADAVVTAQYQSLLSEAAIAVHGFPFVSASALGSALMGALIVSRNERQVIGWLLAVVGTSGAVSMLAEAYAGWVLDGGGPGTQEAGAVAGWVSSLLGGRWALTGLVLMFLLVPDGRLLSRWWAVPGVGAVVGQALWLLGLVTVDPSTYQVSAPMTGIRQVLGVVGIVMICAGLLGALASMVVRLRRSAGVQRQQLRLVAVGAGAVFAGLAWALTVQATNGDEQTWAAILPLFTSYLMLPALLAVAVLRYRLYDVEMIINRTLVLVLGTAFAAAGYVTLVVAVGKVVDGRTSRFWLSLVTTVVVAIAFQPLRRSAVRLANRLAFGARARPYEALAAFNRRLTAAPSAATLLPAVAEAAGRAVSARGATASLDLPGLTPSTASWGRDDADSEHEHAVLVRHGGVALGAIKVTIPRGRPFRDTDLRLLQALADQAAVAFHNVALEAELTAHVAALDRTTKELARSRARIIDADDAVRRALSRTIEREVLPHLRSVEHGLGDSLAQSGTDRTRLLDGLVADVNAALEALRELTHGVFPTQLARAGLEPALRSFLTRRGRSDTLMVEATAHGRRFDAQVEAAVWFCATRAVTSSAGPVSTSIAVKDGQVRCLLGGVQATTLDLQGLQDRVAAVGGSLRLQGGELELRVPVGLEGAPAQKSGPPASRVSAGRQPTPLTAGLG